jgi:hypothetical protein
LRWQARGEAGNNGDVVGEHHSVVVELEDEEAAPDSGRRRLASGRCSAVLA